MPDELDSALQSAINRNGLNNLFPSLNFGPRGLHLAFLVGDAPRKKRQQFTRWVNCGEELPRCSYFPHTSAEDAFRGLANGNVPMGQRLAAAAKQLIEDLELRPYKVLVKPDEPHKQFRERFPSRV